MSLVEYNTFTFLWRIENFSVCYQKVGKFIESPHFQVQGFRGEFYLKLYPRGMDETCSDFISCFLTWQDFSQPKYSLDVTMTLAMLDGNDCVLKEVVDCTTTFKNNKDSVGSDRFEDISELQMEDWKNDAISIRCQMNVSQPKKLQSIYLYKTLTTFGVDKSCAEWDIKTPISMPMSETIEMSILDSYFFKVTFAPMKLIFLIKRSSSNGLPIPYRISFKITVYNNSGDEVSSYRTSKLFVYTANLTLSQFLTQQQMESCKTDSSSYEFKLKLEVYVANGNMISGVDSTECLRFKSTDNQKHISNSGVLCDFRNFYKDKKFCDVTIKTNTGVLHAHRLLLQVRSPVFAAMFDHEMQEKRTGVLEAVDLDAKTVADMLEFLYTDTVTNLDYNRAMNLLMAADRYQIKLLIDECASFLKSVMSPENVCEIFEIADVVNCDFLKNSAFCFIRANTAKVLSSASWFQWSEENKKLTLYILTKLSNDFATTNVL